jgi:hypothetical protein
MPIGWRPSVTTPSSGKPLVECTFGLALVRLPERCVGKCGLTKPTSGGIPISILSLWLPRGLSVNLQLLRSRCAYCDAYLELSLAPTLSPGKP